MVRFFFVFPIWTNRAAVRQSHVGWSHRNICTHDCDVEADTTGDIECPPTADVETSMAHLNVIAQNYMRKMEDCVSFKIISRKIKNCLSA